MFRVDHAQVITMNILMRKIEDAQLSELPEHSEFRHPRDVKWALCFRDGYSDFFTKLCGLEDVP